MLPIIIFIFILFPSNYFTWYQGHNKLKNNCEQKFYKYLFFFLFFDDLSLHVRADPFKKEGAGPQDVQAPCFS